MSASSIHSSAAPNADRAGLQDGGRRRTDDRAMLAAIMYVLESGCSWRKLPGSFPVHWRTPHRRFAERVSLDVMTDLHQATLDVLGVAASPLPSSASRAATASR
jgi:transposase